MSNLEIQRVTVPVTVHTHEVFKRISEASGVSVGRCMSSWLLDTLDAAEYMASKMDQARQSPRIVSRELHSYAAGLSLAADAVIQRAQEQKTGVTPPSSNTGGKLSKSAETPKSQKPKKS